jgi:hypothetical protein
VKDKNKWLEFGPCMPISQESNGRIRYLITTKYDCQYQYRAWWDGSFWFCKDTLSTFLADDVVTFRVAGYSDKTGSIDAWYNKDEL